MIVGKDRKGGSIEPYTAISKPEYHVVAAAPGPSRVVPPDAAPAPASPHSSNHRG